MLREVAENEKCAFVKNSLWYRKHTTNKDLTQPYFANFLAFSNQMCTIQNIVTAASSKATQFFY